MEPEPTPPMESWRRFTLLDLLLLQLAVALGYSVCASLPLDETPWPWRALLGAFCGVLLYGPLVLFVQWAFRGRWASLSVGEWLWLMTTVLWLAAAGLVAFLVATKTEAAFAILGPPVLVAWLATQSVCCIGSWWTLLSEFRRGCNAECVWAHRLGLIVTAVSSSLPCMAIPVALFALRG